MILRADAQVTELPKTIKVVAADGDPIESSEGSRFYVTVETIDPFHAVCELPDGWRFG